MNAYRNNYRHSAIIISLLLHAIFLFLLLSAIIVQLVTSSGKNTGRGTPAPVTMRWGSPAQPATSVTLPSTGIDPQIEESTDQAADVDDTDTQPLAVPIEQKSHIPSVSDYASGKLAIPMEYIKPEVIDQEVEKPKVLPVEVPQEQPLTKAPPKKRRRRRRRIGGQRNAPSMSPRQLMNAFNQNVQKSFDIPYGDPRGNAYGNSADGLSDNQRYAMARAREMGDYRFKGRIDDVLERTFSIYAKELEFDEDIETPVKIEVLINPDGTISQVSFDKATNSKMVNDEIKRVLLRTENIPVPNRFSKEPYRHVIEGWAHISKGRGKMRYVPKPKTNY